MMRRYIDIINESLALPFPIHWEQRSMDRWYGTFMAGDEEYFLMCYHIEGFNHPDEEGKTGYMRSRQEGKWYDMAFSLSRDSFAGTRVIGTAGMQFRIFSTVIAGIREFLNEVHPELIMLSASKQNVNRLPLYKRMVRRFSDDLSALGYQPVAAPDHQYADVRAVADTLAWRRVGEWKPRINEAKLSDSAQKLLDRVPETGSVKVNIDGSVMSTIRALVDAGLVTSKLNTSTFQATLTRAAPQAPPRPKADINTPAFKKWFGGSHVVDQRGDPLIVYHGTDRDFDTFDSNAAPKAFEIDRGKFHFTDDKSQAEFYASDLAGGDLRQTDNPGKPRVIHAYVAIKNPYVIDNCDDPAEEWAQSADIYAKEAERKGCDGIIMQTEDGSHRIVIAFSPNQIKSVENDGTFNPNDPNMNR